MAFTTFDEARKPKFTTFEEARQEESSSGFTTFQEARDTAPNVSFPAAERVRSFRGGTLSRSIDRGVKQSAGLAGQLLRSIGDATGFAAAIDLGDDLIQDSFVEALANPAEITELSDITSLGKLGTFLAQTFGEQAFNLALAGTGAGLGALVGRAAVSRALLKNLAARNAPARGAFTAQQVSKRFFRNHPTGAAGGAATGTFAAFLPINTGEIIQEQRDVFERHPSHQGTAFALSGHVGNQFAATAPKLGPSLALGALSTAIEVLSYAAVVKTFFGKLVSTEAAETMIRIVARRAGYGSLRGIAIEGGTEAVQEVLVIAARKLNDPTFSLSNALQSSAGLNRIAFAGVSGAVVGGGIGGAGGLTTGARIAMRASMERSVLNQSVGEAVDVINATTLSGEDEEQSLFNFALWSKEIVGLGKGPMRAVGAALSAIKNRLGEGATKAANVAARARYSIVAKALNVERKLLRRANIELAEGQARFAAAFAVIEQALHNIPSISGLNKKQNDALHNTGKEIKALIADINKTKLDERARRAIELLNKARELINKGMLNPKSVAKEHIKKLINQAKKHVEASHKRTTKASVAYHETLTKLRTRTANAIKRLLKADGTLTTAQAETATVEDIQEMLGVEEIEEQFDMFEAEEVPGFGVEADMTEAGMRAETLNKAEEEIARVQEEIDLAVAEEAAQDTFTDADALNSYAEELQTEHLAKPIAERDVAKKELDQAVDKQKQTKEEKTVRFEAAKLEEKLDKIEAQQAAIEKAAKNEPLSAPQNKAMRALSRRHDVINNELTILLEELPIEEQEVGQERDLVLEPMSAEEAELAENERLSHLQAGTIEMREEIFDEEPDIEARGIEDTTEDTLPTPVVDIMKSIKKVKDGIRKFAFIVGRTLQNLPVTVERDIASGILAAFFNGKEVVVALKKNEADLPNAHSESFTTQVEDIKNPGDAVVVQSEGRGEVTPKAKIAEVVAKVEAEGEEVTGVVEPDIEITEKVEALNHEAETELRERIKVERDVLSQVYRAITDFLKENPDRTSLTLPDNLVVLTDGSGFPIFWSEWRDQYSDAAYLAKTMMNMETSWADPDRFIAEASIQDISDVRDLQEDLELIQDGRVSGDELMSLISSTQEEGVTLFVRSPNGAMVEAHSTEEGIQREAGSKTKPMATKQAAIRIIKLPSNVARIAAVLGIKTSQVVNSEGDIIDKVQIMKVGNEFIIRVSLPDTKTSASDRQVRVAIRRGEKHTNEQKNPELVISGRKVLERDEKTDEPTKLGGRILFHLGEITQLGYIISDNRTTTADRLLSAHEHFLAGMTALRTTYDFLLDFQPFPEFHKGKITKQARPSDMKKIIYGKVTFEKSFNTRDDFSSVKQTWKETGDRELVTETIKWLMEQPGKINWSSVSDWLANTAQDLDIDERPKATRLSTKNEEINRVEKLAEEKLTEDEKELAEELSNIESKDVVDTVDPNSIATVLWDQGHFDDSLIASLRDDVEEEGTKDLTYKDFLADDRNPSKTTIKIAKRLAAEANQATAPRGRAGEVARKGSLPGEEKEGRTSAQDFPVQNAVRNLQLGYYQHTTHEETGQVRNFLTTKIGTIWKPAQAAVEFTVKMLNIKEPITLFDEFSAQGLIGEYRFREKNATSKKQAAVFRRYRRLMEEAIADKIPGRIFAPNKRVAKRDRITHIFVSKKLRNTTKIKGKQVSVTRGFTLMHEVGHLVQYTHLDALSPKLRAQILGDMRGSTDLQRTEAFANWMTKVAVDIHFGRKIRAGSEVDNIFINIVQDLKRVWTRLKGILDYKPNFAEFVAALHAHAAVQRGDIAEPPTFKTELGEAIFKELQEADAGAYISTNVVDLMADFNPSIDGLTERSQNSMFGNYVDDFKRWATVLKDDPMQALKYLVQIADSELRSMGSPFALWLAQQFRPLPSSNESSFTVNVEIMLKRGPIQGLLEKVLKTMPIARISLWEGIVNKHPTPAMKVKREHRDKVSETLLNQIPDEDVSADVKQEVRSIRNFLKVLYDWYTSSGTVDIDGKEMKGMNMELKERGFSEGRPSFYPLMLDSDLVENRKEEFVDILVKHNFSKEQAQRRRWKIVQDEDGGLNHGFHESVSTDEFFGPGASFRRRRAERSLWTDELRADLVEAGFYQKDIATTLLAYSEMMIRRAVWERRFAENELVVGDLLKRYDEAGIDHREPVAKLKLRAFEAWHGGELSNRQYQRIMRDILPAYAGQLGLRTNNSIRKFNSAIVIYQNLRLLPFAIFSQYVDVGTLIARGGFKEFEASFQGILNKTTRDEARIMLQVLGGLRLGLTEHVLSEQALSTFMTGTSKRINDLFFRYNLMEGWTNVMRTLGLIAGREHIMRHAPLALKGDATSQKYMDYLGLGLEENLKDAVVWNGYTTDNDIINAALLRYVDESMIRPGSSIRPVHMSDAGYIVFNHLKQFLWGFWATFIQRGIREAKIHQNYLPLLTLGMLALPFAAVGYELRRYITTGGNPRPSPEGLGYMQELWERSGLLGPFQLIVDMEQADAYGKPFLLGIGGPAVEQMHDFITSDLDAWLSKAIPVASAVPAFRDLLRDTL